MAERPRLAFVVQRAGAEVVGGAEALCVNVARRLAARCEIEILTTCARDYMTWANVYPPGPGEIDGVPVRRFAVDRPRNVRAFDRLSRRLAGDPAASLEQQGQWMRAQGPEASALFAYLREAEGAYDAFVFFTYLYATTYFGLPLVARRAVLVPAAHDEWTLGLSMWDLFFTLPRGFVFNSPEERALLARRFPHLALDGPVAATAVDPPPVDPEGFRAGHALHDPFLLYVGRVDESKGCGELLELFLALRARESGARKLVLLGPVVMEVPPHPDVVVLGETDEATKWNALAAAELLVVPSRYESLSIVALEAWSVGTPVLVNGLTPPLVGLVRRANGGLWYTGGAEFEYLVTSGLAGKARQLGEQGRAYVRAAFTWDGVVRSYEQALEPVLSARELTG